MIRFSGGASVGFDRLLPSKPKNFQPKQFELLRHFGELPLWAKSVLKHGTNHVPPFGFTPELGTNCGDRLVPQLVPNPACKKNSRHGSGAFCFHGSARAIKGHF